RALRGRLVRGRDGVPGPVLHGDERARGDARDRAAHHAPGPPRVPEDLPGDAPAHRRAGRPSRDRGRDDLRRPLGRRARAARGRARGGAAPRRRLSACSPAPPPGSPSAALTVGGRLDDNWSPNQEKSMSPKVGVAPLRREQIVRATIRCLARDGYAGLTLKKVARTAGVSQGILHYYFADKRAILDRKSTRLNSSHV